MIADNKLTLNGGWDNDLLKVEFADLTKSGFDTALLGFAPGELNGPGPAPQSGAGSLAERFGVPPFSILNAREGWWQDRKRAWIALGIQSELGRGQEQCGSPRGMSETIHRLKPTADQGRKRAMARANAAT